MQPKIGCAKWKWSIKAGTKQDRNEETVLVGSLDFCHTCLMLWILPSHIDLTIWRVIFCFSHKVMFDSFVAPMDCSLPGSSVGFPRQEYWSGLPFPSLGCLPDPGIELVSPALAAVFFTTEPPGNSYIKSYLWRINRRRKKLRYDLWMHVHNMLRLIKSGWPLHGNHSGEALDISDEVGRASCGLSSIIQNSLLVLKYLLFFTYSTILLSTQSPGNHWFFFFF